MIGSCPSCRTGVGAKPKLPPGGGGGPPGVVVTKPADGGGGGGGRPVNMGAGSPKGGSSGPPGAGGGSTKLTGFRAVEDIPVRRVSSEPIQGGGGGGPPPPPVTSIGLSERASAPASRMLRLASVLASRVLRLASTLRSRMMGPSPPTAASCIIGSVPKETRSAAAPGGGGGPGPRRASSCWAKSSP